MANAEAQNVLSVNNLNWRPGNNGNHSTGIFGNPVSEGTLIVQPPNANFTGFGGENPTDFLFRWDGLTLDGAGVADDYIDFTIRVASTGDLPGNIAFGGEGSGINRGAEDDAVGISAGEEMTIEIVDISLRPETLGSVEFDGFTGAGFFASGNAGGGMSTVGSVQAEVNGSPAVVELDGTAYTFSTDAVTFEVAPTVVINNTVTNDPAVTPDPTVTPNGRLRHASFSFTYSEVVGAPEISGFSLGVGDETEGYYFTTGNPSNDADGVFDLSVLGFDYDVANGTELTLKRDGDVETVLPLEGGMRSGRITPEAPGAGVYSYTIEVTNGADTVSSQPITVSVDQPYVLTEASTRSTAGKIGIAGSLPLFISASGDFDTEDADHGLFLSFADQEGTLTPAGAGGSGDPSPGNLTLDYQSSSVLSNNFAPEEGSERLDVPVADIVAAIETENGITLTYPFAARATISAVNPAGAATQEIDFMIMDSQILVELDPATFVVGSGILENQWISPFLNADEVANNDIQDISGDGTVTFDSVVSGGIALGSNDTGIQSGIRSRDVTVSTWILIPEDASTGGLIMKFGGNSTGTAIGYEQSTGELIARMQGGGTSQATAVVSPGWHHLAVTLDIGPDSAATIYIDGKFAGAGEADGESDSWANPQVSGLFSDPAAIGFAGKDIPLFGAASLGDGLAGNLRLYSGILSEETIAQLSTEFFRFSGGPLQITDFRTIGKNLLVEFASREPDGIHQLQRSVDLITWEPLEASFSDLGKGLLSAQSVFPGTTMEFVRVALLGDPPIFFDDFESGGEGWTIGGANAADTQWELGAPTVGPGSAFSGDNVYGTDLDGPFAPGAVLSLRSPVIDLEGQEARRLKFQYYIDTTEGAEGGRLNFLEANGDLLVNDSDLILWGNSGGWVEYNQSLPEAVRGRQFVLEFQFLSDNEEPNGAGWYIDDVEISK